MTITDEMIEAAAKAISSADPIGKSSWDDTPKNGKDFYKNLARAALTAVLPMMEKVPPLMSIDTETNKISIVGDDGWQPIADYKDDGLEREFLVAAADGWVTAATWSKTKYHGDGWLDGGDFENRDSYTARPLRGITHFRPLPPPPKGDGT